MLTRRGFVTAGGLLLAGLAVPRAARAARTVEIRMRSDTLGTQVWFDPIGVHVEPGATIRWVVEQNVHTTTAYHPRNDMHSLRIPEQAQPWNSGYLVQPGAHFEVMLTAEGVYDYFCAPHEIAGMVGRIVVGKPGGPGALPFDYFKGKPGTKDWKVVPAVAERAFPAVTTIMAHGIVRKS
jgi:plastocyanin